MNCNISDLRHSSGLDAGPSWAGVARDSAVPRSGNKQNKHTTRAMSGRDEIMSGHGSLPVGIVGRIVPERLGS